MRLRVGIKSSELSRLLTATATASGRPGKRVLRGRVGKHQVKSQYDQHVEKDGPVAFAQCSLNGSGAAVGATDAAISRQQILSRSAAIPMTPQFIVDWLYQALLDTVRVFETIMGTASYDASGVANSTGSGEVLLFWGPIWEACVSKDSFLGMMTQIWLYSIIRMTSTRLRILLRNSWPR